MFHKIVTQTFHEVYTSVKDGYEIEYFNFHKYRYHYLLNKIVSLRLIKNTRILDVGCYPLHMYKALNLLGYDVSGISSPHEPIHASNITTFNLETDSLPYSRGYFELIVFSEVMEHLVVSPLIYLEKLKEVLSPTGTFMITTPNSAGLHKIIPILLGRSTYFPLTDVFTTLLEDGSIYKRHNREYTLSELIYILKRANFSIKTGTYFNAYRSFLHKEAEGKPIKVWVRKFAYILTELIPRLKDTLYLEFTHQIKKN